MKILSIKRLLRIIRKFLGSYDITEGKIIGKFSLEKKNNLKESERVSRRRTVELGDYFELSDRAWKLCKRKIVFNYFEFEFSENWFPSAIFFAPRSAPSRHIPLFLLCCLTHSPLSREVKVNMVNKENVKERKVRNWSLKKSLMFEWWGEGGLSLMKIRESFLVLEEKWNTNLILFLAQTSNKEIY